MELSVLCPFFFILFIFPLQLHKFVTADTAEYDECKKPFLCGDSQVNLSYPFYDGENRPPYCGYPGFKIDCNSTYPEISMPFDQIYNLRSMNANSDTISVSMQSYDNYCPQNLLNFTLYKYAFTKDNVTLFFDCPATAVGTLPCSNASNNDNQVSYYEIQISGSSQQSQAERLNQTCQSSIVVPSLLQSGSQTAQNLGRFELEWIAENQKCDGCRGSGGECGYNENKSRFTCYCANGAYDSDCRGTSSSKKGVIIGVLVGGGLAAAVLAGYIFLRRRKKKQVSQTLPKDPLPANLSTDLPSSNEFRSSSQDETTTTTTPSNNLSQSMPSSYPSSNLEDISSYHGVNIFSYTELEQATDNFNESRQLGDGGFGVVYYGKLQDGRVVAVKRLYENSIKRMGQFMNEVTILAHLRHDNLVTLYGCTSKTSRELLLVYEYIPNGTVADHLHGKLSVSGKLTWSIRLKIAIETAEALSYLHDNDVIHRDVKTTNILLDNDFQVKVADFGLSRLFPNDVTHVSTAPQGTPGYVDPYYYQCFRLTEKSDVYSFGVVLIELISSKIAVDVNRNNLDINLAIMAVDRIQKQAINELVDPDIGYNEDYLVEKMVKLMAELAFQCLQHNRELRPSMKEVLETLREIQKEMVNAQKQVVVYIQESDDDAGALLKNAPPFSPETHVNNRWY